MIESKAHVLLSLVATYSDSSAQLIKESLNVLTEQDKKQNIQDMELAIIDLFNNPIAFFNKLPDNPFKKIALWKYLFISI
jgi:hypothetical protein